MGEEGEIGIGTRVRLHREERSMTQEHLAELAGVSRQTIVEIEADKGRGPRWSTVLRIARALDVPEHEILGVAFPGTDEMNEYVAEIFRSVPLLPPDGQRTVRDLVRMAIRPTAGMTASVAS